MRRGITKQQLMAVLIAASGAGESNYDPFNDYATVTTWYSHKDQSTLFQDSAGTTPAGTGDPVGRWADKSGNAYHQLQATTAAKPTNTVDGLLFDGTDDWLQAVFGTTFAQPNTIFLVMKVVAAANFDCFYDGVVSTARHNLQYSSGYRMFAGNVIATPVLFDTNNHVFTNLYNGASSRFRKDTAETTGDTGGQSLSGITLGARFDGTVLPNIYIQEMIVVPEAAPLAKIQATEAALAEQYGITL